MASELVQCRYCSGSGIEEYGTVNNVGCHVCGGSGRVEPDPSFGCALTLVLVVAVLAVPVVVIVVVTSWWVPLGGAIRSVLELLLPGDLVARSASEHGRPVVVGIGVGVVALAAAAVPTVLRRREVRRLGSGGSLVRAHLYGLARVLVLTGGAGLALVSGGIASGNDLRWSEVPPVYTAWWQVLVTVLVVGTWSALGTGRLVVRRAEHTR